jgi:hypothetical protein
MSDLGTDMSGLGRICPVIINFEERKSRSGDKMMQLCPDKLTIRKLDNIELRELTVTIRSNLNSRNQT